MEEVTLKTQPISQHSVATALVQLLKEHPELSDVLSWTIGRVRPTLTGVVHTGGMEVLDRCAGIVGGSVEVSAPYGQDGRMVRQHVLSSVWRDVPVEVIVSLPVAVEAVAA
jgi:hypothetical protein